MAPNKDLFHMANEGFVVYADVSINSISKKVRSEQLYVVNPDGEIILDSSGGIIGFYGRHLTQRMLKEFVKLFAESQLREGAGLDVNIALKNVVLKGYDEIGQILNRAASEVHQHLRDLR
jgi:hypothetical protein